MASKKVNRADGSDGGPDTAGDARTQPMEDGPQSEGPWGTAGGVDRPPPWGVSEDSPMDEGSERAAVGPAHRGERRTRAEPSGRSGRHGFGTVEPTPVPEAGPGGAPDAAPGRRPFPDETATGDMPDNPLERQTGMRPEGVSESE
jgi:hypothetical protein